MSLIEEVVKRVEELAKRMAAVEARLDMGTTLDHAEQDLKLEAIQSMLADIAGTLHAQNAKLNAIAETLDEIQG